MTFPTLLSTNDITIKVAERIKHIIVKEKLHLKTKHFDEFLHLVDNGDIKYIKGIINYRVNCFKDFGLLLPTFKRQGSSIKLNKNNQVVYTNSVFLDDMLHGDHISYYKEGGIKEVATFNRGKLHGEYTLHYPNGKPHKYVEYENGLIHGQYIVYDETSGNIKLKCKYWLNEAMLNTIENHVYLKEEVFSNV